MSIRAVNKAAFRKQLALFALRYEKALVRELEIMVEELSNYAKDNAGYEDRTGNLKASIGGIVLKNGRPISYLGFEGAEEGSKIGREFIDDITSQYTSGFVALVVAGMEYAVYVEDFYNKNVLKKSEMRLPTEMKKLFNRMKDRIDRIGL